MKEGESACSFDDINFAVIVVQSLSHVQLFATPWTETRQGPLSFTISQSLLKFMSIESMMLSNHLILCCPSSPPEPFPASAQETHGKSLVTEQREQFRMPASYSVFCSLSPDDLCPALSCLVHHQQIVCCCC